MSRPEAIPAILHQTWKDEHIPERWQAFRASWARCWPEWRQLLWTDADNRALVAICHPELLDAYDTYPRPIMRADLARYCMLERFGGIYADLDCECLRPFPELLSVGQLIFGLEPAAQLGPAAWSRGLRKVVSNALIAGPPGHPFWAELFAELALACHKPEPLDATGPFLLSRVLESWRRDLDHAARVTILDERHFFPLSKFECWERPVGAQAKLPQEAVAIHHWDGSWWRPARELEKTFASIPASIQEGPAAPKTSPTRKSQDFRHERTCP